MRSGSIAAVFFLSFFLMSYSCSADGKGISPESPGVSEIVKSAPCPEDFFADLLSGGILKNIKKSVSVEGVHDDNVYQTQSNRKRDYYAALYPSISYDFPRITAGNKFKILTDIGVGLDGDFEYYRNNTTRLNRAVLLPSGYFVSEIADRLTLQGNISKSDSTAAGQTSGKATVSSWTDFYGFSYLMGPNDNIWQLACGHSDTIYQADQNAGDQASNSASLTSYLGKPIGNQGFITYAISKTDRLKQDSEDKHLIANAIAAGVTNKMPGNFSYDFGAGYGMLNAKGHRIGDLACDPIWLLSVRYKYSNRLVFGLQTNRTVGASVSKPSISANAKEGDEEENINEAYAYSFKVPQYLAQSEKATDTANLNVSYVPSYMPERLSLGGSAGISRMIYVSGDQNLSYFTGFNVKYRLNERVSLSPRYDYTRTLSSQNITGYINNVFTIQLTMEF